MSNTPMPRRTPKAHGAGDAVRIRREAEERGIGRLCHFTAERNISPILLEGRGVVAPKFLPGGRWKSKRLDGLDDHACLSVEFPNTRLLKKRATLGRKDGFVVLYARTHYLWRSGTKFCAVNAATERGNRIADGHIGFQCMFDQTVTGSRRSCRQPRRLACAPTDEQAEVLVPRRIASTDILGIAVRDERQACRVSARWPNPSDAPPIVMVPEYYDPYTLTGQLRSGRRPAEHPWRPGGTHDD